MIELEPLVCEFFFESITEKYKFSIERRLELFVSKQPRLWLEKPLLRTCLWMIFFLPISKLQFHRNNLKTPF